MTQVATVREIKTHESIMGPHDRLVDLQIRRATTQALNIDAPFLRVQMEGRERASLAGQLNGVDVLVSTIVSCTWVTFGVLIRHG